MKDWGLEQALQCWGIAAWGGGLFDLNDVGNLCVVVDDCRLDLKQLVDAARHRGIEPPLLIRLVDLLGFRVKRLNECFKRAIDECGYVGEYRCVYPLKVNQQRHVVEKLLEAGRPYHLGIEVGSKPELLAAVAQCEDPEALLLCNGYKDDEFIENALLARRLQHDVIIILDRPDEVEVVLDASLRLGIEARLGLRAKLAAPGAGRWQESTGPRAKFGLTVPEIVDVVEKLERAGQLDSLLLLHFHIGSQINDIVAFKRALREAARLYVSLRQRGAPLRYLDVGGGLGVDYTGNRSRVSPSSLNYTMQEYANDVVFWVAEACEQAEEPPPTLISESGRALVAHHSLLVFDVLTTNERKRSFDLEQNTQLPPRVVRQLLSLYDSVTAKNALEYYADLVHLRNDYLSLFNHGLLDLGMRSLAERVFWACCWRIREHIRDVDADREELAQLDAELADIYYCNFSVFQSLPDIWAIDQLFPVVPLQRLLERPTRRAVLADITCDSDGQIRRFIGDGETAGALQLHELTNEEYHIGVFLIGAYQESLGDLHNLFGDTNAIHVSLTDNGGYRIEEVIEGETVADVLRYMQYKPDSLMARLRTKVDDALQAGRLNAHQSRSFLRSHAEALRGYTYLEREYNPITSGRDPKT